MTEDETPKVLDPEAWAAPGAQISMREATRALSRQTPGARRQAPELKAATVLITAQAPAALPAPKPKRPRTKKQSSPEPAPAQSEAPSPTGVRRLAPGVSERSDVKSDMHPGDKVTVQGRGQGTVVERIPERRCYRVALDDGGVVTTDERNILAASAAVPSAEFPVPSEDEAPEPGTGNREPEAAAEDDVILPPEEEEPPKKKPGRPPADKAQKGSPRDKAR